MLFKYIYIFCCCLLAGVLSAQTTFTVDAGPYKKICPGTQTQIGGNPTANGGSGFYKYSWHPGRLLYNYDSTIANPIATPNATTTYTLLVTDSVSRKTDTATVTVYVYPYSINAGQDVTIRQGETATLHGQAPGDSIVWWGTNSPILNQNTLNPDVTPGGAGKDSIILIAKFPHGCVLYDNLIITVLPSTELTFFNSFSPNGDGANDVFYIGNLGLYPNNTLEIYNRYGQKVLSKSPYINDWNGSYLGTELPSGTYFYLLDTHDDKGGKYKGEVNIIR